MNIVNLRAGAADTAIISAIVDRVEDHYCLMTGERIGMEMDITATHLNGCPLMLSDLLTAPAGSFWHDIGGIQRHINRDTGALEDFFLPRYAASHALDDDLPESLAA